MSGRSPDQDVWSTDRVAGIQTCILSRLFRRNAGTVPDEFRHRSHHSYAKISANGQQIILPFLCRSRSARSTNWQSGKFTKCALIQTPLRFVCRAVCDAQKPRNGAVWRDRMCNCRTAHARPNNCHLVRAAPRHPCAVCGQKKTAWRRRSTLLSLSRCC